MGIRYGNSACYHFVFDGRGPTAPAVFAKIYGLPPPPLGIDSISEQFISAHLKSDKEALEKMGEGNTIAELIYRYHAVLHDWCDYDDDDEDDDDEEKEE